MLLSLPQYRKFGKTYHNCNQKAKELFDDCCEHSQFAMLKDKQKYENEDVLLIFKKLFE